MLTLLALTCPFGTYIDETPSGSEGGGAGDGGGGGPSTPTSGGDAGAGSAVPSAPQAAPGAGVSAEWNGEMESLRNESWFKDLPVERQTQLEAGLRTKHSNWQRGFQTKMGTFAKEKEELTRQLAEARSAKDMFSEMLGQEEAIKPLTDKLSGLETALSAKDTEIQELRGKVEGFESERATAFVQNTLSRHEREYADIYADFVEDPDYGEGKPKDVAEPTGAYVEFTTLVRALGGGEAAEKRAAKIVRAEMAERAGASARPPDPPAEVVPKAVRLAGTGGGPRASDTTRDPNETYEQARRRVLGETAGQEEDDDD